MSKGTFNSVTLVGRLGDNARKDDTRALILLATSDFNGKDEITNWHNLKAHGKMADYCVTYLRKGDKVAVKGRLWNGLFGTEENKTYIEIDEIERI